MDPIGFEASEPCVKFVSEFIDMPKQIVSECSLNPDDMLLIIFASAVLIRIIELEVVHHGDVLLELKLLL